MTGWHIAMIALFPLILSQRLGGDWPVHKLRTWAALLGSSVAAWICTWRLGLLDAPVWLYILGFIVIDIKAAQIVLRRPAGTAQYAIGMCYVLMLSYHAGVMWAALWGDADMTKYESFINFAGWGQFAILLVWSGRDVGGCVLRWLGRLGHLEAFNPSHYSGR
jgi:hypothetical protein